MRRPTVRFIDAAAGCWLAIALAGCGAPRRGGGTGADVLTAHDDAARSGATLAETRLKPDLLTPQSFGRLYDRNVEGGIVAQPLFVRGVGVDRRDLVIVTTETNWVYAFDLDDDSPNPATPPLAARRLQPTGRAQPAVCGETPSKRVGITSTPVIDPATATLFAVARNADDHQYYLHALDLTAGLRDRSPPVRIAAAAPGAPEVTFSADCQRNRPALLLQNGIVYVAFGSLSCDRDCPDGTAYRGWVLGYRAADLTQAAVFCTSPDDGHAGIWQGGGGLVGAGDRLFFETGNGPGRLGNAFVALRTLAGPPGLALAAARQPYNHLALDRADVDLGSGSPLWLPPGRLLGGGKEGRYDLLDADTLAPVQSGPTSTDPREGFQAFANSYHGDPTAPPCPTLARSAFPTNCDTATDPGCYVAPERYQDGEDCGPNVNGGPVFWRHAGPDYGLVYQMAGRDYLKAFRYDERSGRLSEKPFAISTVRAVEGMAGGFSSLSADGDRDAILWVSYPLGDGQWQNVPGRLAAFDARTLRELWHDDGGYLFAKFTPPTIADGRVIRATLSGKVVVYGPRAAAPARSGWRRVVDRLAALVRPAPWTPPPVSGRAAVDEKYRLAGGETGYLGRATSDARPIQDAAGGWAQDFHGVVIGAVPATIAARQAVAGAPPAPGHRPWSGLGTPFESSIYWSLATGAHVVTGEIRDAWLAGGGPGGPLGYPVADEAAVPGGGRVSRFQHGEIAWSSQAGAAVHPQP